VLQGSRAGRQSKSQVQMPAKSRSPVPVSLLVVRVPVTAVLIIAAFTLAGAQSAPVRDSSSLDPALLGNYRSLFGPKWSNNFAEAWNATGDSTRALAGLGKVYFISVAEETTAVLMEFDSAGRAFYRSSLPPPAKDTLPRFTARRVRWAEFMEGKFGAIEGVLSRKIEYAGPMAIAFKYGFPFRKVAPVGRRVSELVSKAEKKR
jgi:hypothetical protein